MTNRVREPAYCEGGPEARADVREFLKRYQKSLENEAVMEVRLHESSKGQPGDMVEQYEVGFDEDDLENVVRKIVVDAEMNALVLRGRVKYAVKIEGYGPTLTFGLEAIKPGDSDLGDDEEDADDLDDLERPDKKGLLGQAMRHAEHSSKDARMASRLVREVARDTRSENRELRMEIAELRGQLRRMYRTEQELHNLDYLRRRDERREIKSDERREKLIATAAPMLPAIGAKLLGLDPVMLFRMMAAQAPQPTAPPPPAPAPVTVTAQPQAGADVWSPIETRAASVLTKLSQLDEETQGILMRTLPAELLLELQVLDQEIRMKTDQGASGASSSSSASKPAAVPINGMASAYGG